MMLLSIIMFSQTYIIPSNYLKYHLSLHNPYVALIDICRNHLLKLRRITLTFQKGR